MKVKNIMFSGFMAAVLMSVAGNASAAVSVASKAYVDAQVDAVETNVTDIQTALAEGGTTQTAIAAAQSAANTAQEKADANAESIETLSATVETKANASDLTAKEDVANKLTGTLTADTLNSMSTEEKSTKYTSVAAAESIANIAITEVNEVAGDLGTLKTQVETNTADISSLSAKVGTASVADSIASALTDGKYTTEETVDSKISSATENLVSNDTLTTKLESYATTTALTAEETARKAADTAATEALAGKQDTLTGTGYVTVDQDNDTVSLTVDGAIAADNTGLVTGGTVYTYAIPKPSAECTAASGACVLSSDTSGNLTWVMITDPVSGTEQQ